VFGTERRNGQKNHREYSREVFEVSPVCHVNVYLGSA
jgi:hypothetical protein